MTSRLGAGHVLRALVRRYFEKPPLILSHSSPDQFTRLSSVATGFPPSILPSTQPHLKITAASFYPSRDGPHETVHPGRRHPKKKTIDADQYNSRAPRLIYSTPERRSRRSRRRSYSWPTQRHVARGDKLAGNSPVEAGCRARWGMGRFSEPSSAPCRERVPGECNAFAYLGTEVGCGGRGTCGRGIVAGQSSMEVMFRYFEHPELQAGTSGQTGSKETDQM